MTFILITGSIMAISIFLIYRLCRFLGIEMKWTSLVLCAVMAFIVNGMAITMSPFLDRGHYLRLGILVVTAAAIVTLFNERLLRREEAMAGNITPLATEVIAAEDMPGSPPEVEQSAESEPLEPAAVETTAQAVTAEAPETSPAEKAAAKQAAEEAILAAEAQAAEKAAAERAKAQALAKAEAEAQKKALAEKAAQEAKLQEERAAAQRRQAAEEAERLAKEKAAQAEAQRLAQEKAAAHQQELQVTIAQMSSLDDILDYAYAAKSQTPQDAIFAYQEAIARYSDDDYTPYLIIELGNLYKEQADYRGAIATYAKAMHMPIIADNDAMRQEFSKNIRYLGTVQDILAKHSALSTPFPQIPGSIMQEIEAEFQSQSDRAAN